MIYKTTFYFVDGNSRTWTKLDKVPTSVDGKYTVTGDDGYVDIIYERNLLFVECILNKPTETTPIPVAQPNPANDPPVKRTWKDFVKILF